MTRLAHAWRALEREQRLAACASLGLFASMLLPWYSKTDTVVVQGAARATQASLTAFAAFSFVEAAVLLVSAGMLAMLFARAEGRVFQLPGGDGLIVMIAGSWSALLIFYRLLDKPGLHGNQRITATVGVQWGIFIALLLALGLLYAGARMRAAEDPEAPLTRPRGARPGGDWERPAEADEEQTLRRPRGGNGVGYEGSESRGERDVAPVPADPHDERTVRTRAGSLPLPSTAAAARQRRAAPAPGAPEPPGSDAPAGQRPSPGRRTPSGRPRYPPAPAEQMSFEEQPPAEPSRPAEPRPPAEQ